MGVDATLLPAASEHRITRLEPGTLVRLVYTLRLGVSEARATIERRELQERLEFAQACGMGPTALQALKRRRDLVECERQLKKAKSNLTKILRSEGPEQETRVAIATEYLRAIEGKEEDLMKTFFDARQRFDNDRYVGVRDRLLRRLDARPSARS